jgi:GAF domain-containing protein
LFGTPTWQQWEIDLLSSLATQVAIAIEQSALFKQVQELNANLERQVQKRTTQLQQSLGLKQC